ncbi:MAG: hypothetical protein M1818_000875 [Claussenomyces sp. TS43310]|nr:MAG: hypothetical protein M1818_000875 [Claussenomyces sp. TS43310]
MDHYGSNNISTSSSYSSLPSIAPQQLQQNASQPAHTLPPLQPQHAAMSMHSMYGQPMTAPHTPSPSAPNTPGSVGNGGYQQQMGNQPPSRGYQLHGNPYQPQTIQPYQTSSAMMPQTSSAMSHPQPIAPAPAPNRLVPLRPMTSAPPLQHSLHGQMPPGMSSPYSQQALPPQDHETPTHVVGSQGRRGILPSAPGRPAVSATGTGATKNAVIPAKDADGKFPCPHCTKTYLHAKHLKRHLLRHTGDRPYMCVLCRDTFSRSDILKRHFQKCSIRRGNPTGASHLSHAQAHLKKSHPGPHKASGPSSADGDLMRNINGLGGGISNDQVLLPFGVAPLSDSTSHMGEDHSQHDHASRSSSLKRLSSGGTPQDRRSLNGPGSNGSNRAGYEQGYNNGIPSTMASSMNSQLAGFSMSGGQSSSSFGQNYDFPTQNGGHSMHAQSNGDMSSVGGGRGGMPMYGGAPNAQQPGVDWSHMFQPGARNGFVSSFTPNSDFNQFQKPMAIKPDPY